MKLIGENLKKDEKMEKEEIMKKVKEDIMLTIKLYPHKKGEELGAEIIEKINRSCTQKEKINGRDIHNNR